MRGSDIESGIDELRATVRALDWNNEDFNQRFTSVELLRIAACLRACGWDYMPDQWNEVQVQEALHGDVPDWAEEGVPCKPNKSVREVYPHLWPKERNAK